MKHFTAIIAALLITTVIGLGIMVIGVSAINNPNTVPLQNSQGSSTGTDPTNAGNAQGVQPASTSAQVQQLQQQVSALQSQLNQASQQIQIYQSILSALQQRGVISIDRNGNIFLNTGGEFSDH